jgi:hypothetical protein
MANESASRVRLNDCIQYIVSNIKLQQASVKKNIPSPVIYISGAPGIGKSDVLSQIAIKLGMGLNPQYLGTMLVEQFGLPQPQTDPTAKFQKWSWPEIYSVENLRIQPTEGSGTVLFLDDIHLANKTIQTYLFQLFTYRSIHNKRMPDNFVMVAAGNRSIDKAGAQAIMAPIVNRFYFVDVYAEADDWLNNFALPNNVRSDVTTFISYYPQLLQSEPLESKPWASPRSWTYFAQALDQFEQEYTNVNLTNCIILGSGHVGLDYATKFSEYRELFAKWNAEAILAGVESLPDISKIGKIDAYTLMAALSSALLKTLRQNKFDLKDETILKKVAVVKKMFSDLSTSAREIIPLGLRTLIVTEAAASNKAFLYYKLVENNDYLVEAAKKILDLK